MKIFYDTEFLENGRTIDLISIGMIAEDGRELYAINAHMPLTQIGRHEWLMANVVPSLPLTHHPGSGPWDHDHGDVPPPRAYAGGLDWDRAHPDALRVCAPDVIANAVKLFIQATPDPELWAYFAAYDHVALCQLWGRMIDLPAGVPRYTRDLKQEAARQGNPPLPRQAHGLHNALADARHNLEIAKALGLV